MPSNRAGFLGRGPQLEGGTLLGWRWAGNPSQGPSCSLLPPRGAPRFRLPLWGWVSFAESGLCGSSSLLGLDTDFEGPWESAPSKSVSSPKNRRVSALKSPLLGINFCGGDHRLGKGRGQINEPVSERPPGDSS